MYTEWVRFYDALHSFKDYDMEADRLREVIRRHHPSAQSLLDVACGTGTHLGLLRTNYEVEGLDLSGEMLEIAGRRCPGVPLHNASMVDFKLGKAFDVITLLFGSIAYVQSLENMRATVATIARHLNRGGLLVLEPWFGPDQYWTDRVTMNVVDEPDLKIVRMYTSAREGLLSVLDINYLVGTPERVEHFTERHELGLFTPEEYTAAFQDAGLDVQYDAHGLSGRGMYLGVRRAAELWLADANAARNVTPPPV